jgi:hypothetical protein
LIVVIVVVVVLAIVWLMPIVPPPPIPPRITNTISLRDVGLCASNCIYPSPE